MIVDNPVIGHWYSAMYNEGFRILFQLVSFENGTYTLCREDGTIINSISQGYLEILNHGEQRPVL